MTDTIYLAGGCFWGTQRLMSMIPGVCSGVCGYANGYVPFPSYEQVCSGMTGYRETVKVDYETEKVSLEIILYIFFESVDVTVKNRQGHDSGEQYQSGVYYISEEQKKIIGKVVRSVEARLKAHEMFCTEIMPLTSFYAAEEYHQDYLVKNPGGYCHVPVAAIANAKEVIVDAAKYTRPSDMEIRKMLTTEAYEITQKKGTEPPFANAYNDFFEEGIYVDVVTGEPLFSSADKFSCGCGWPSFSKPIDPHVVLEKEDLSHGMRRTEVISRVGATHLGHVFFGEGLTDTNRRYCIDSASVRFISLSDMKKEDSPYHDLLLLFAGR